MKDNLDNIKYDFDVIRNNQYMVVACNDNNTYLYKNICNIIEDNMLDNVYIYVNYLLQSDYYNNIKSNDLIRNHLRKNFIKELI